METTPLREIAGRFLTLSNNFVPVVDARQRLLGVVALQDLKEFLNNARELDGVIAYDVMRPPPQCLTPGQRLLDALPLVLESELRNMPVVNSLQENRLVGSVSRAELLAYSPRPSRKKASLWVTGDRFGIGKVVLATAAGHLIFPHVS